MKKLLFFCLFFVGLVGGFLRSYVIKNVYAETSGSECKIFTPNSVSKTSDSVSFNVGPVQIGQPYHLEIETNIRPPFCGLDPSKPHKIKSAVITATEAYGNSLPFYFTRGGSSCNDLIFDDGDSFNTAKLYKDGGSAPLCINRYSIVSTCELEVNPAVLDTETSIKVAGKNVPPAISNSLTVSGPSGKKSFDVNIDSNHSFVVDIGNLATIGGYQIDLVQFDQPRGGTKNNCGSLGLKVGLPGEGIDNGGNSKTKQDTPIKAFEPLRCSSDVGTGINTALGCIPTDDANNFVAWFLRWAIGISGGIAFLLMLVAGLQIMTASGNPEKVQAGRELLTSAISGLILIIFSVFLLRLIGVEILKIF